jgi:hypothetical protein
VIVSGLSSVTVPVHSPTVGTNTELLIQQQPRSRKIWRFSEVQTAIRRKVEVDDLFELLTNCFYAPDLIAHVHGRPLFVQWNPWCMFHDNIFATDGIRSVVAPVQYLRNRDSSLSLHYKVINKPVSHSAQLPSTQSRCAEQNLQYLIVATSEFVVNLEGPANAKGSLATTRLALSVWNMNTLLKPPSFLSYEVTELAPGHSATTLRHRASKSKCTRRDSRSRASRRSHRPLV